MIKRFFFITVGLVVFVSSVSCSTTNRFALDLGSSQQMALSNQILNPDAEENLEPVSGLDGAAASTIMDQYRKGFEKPAATSLYTINLGDVGGGPSSR